MGKEIKENFDGLSVVIPTRNEKYLLFTIENLARVRGVIPLEVLVVNDGGTDISWVKDHQQTDFEIKFFNWPAPVGLCPSRDLAIVEAKYTPIFVIDAHMDFSYNSLEPLVEYIIKHPSHISCMKVRGLKMPGGEWTNSEYYGADILLKSQDMRIGRRRLFPSKWTNTSLIRLKHKKGEISEVCGVLGACYGLNRNHYIINLKRPWKYLHGWGTSEQNISIPNWLMGGKNVLLPLECAHWFKPAHEGQEIGVHHIIHNQLRLLYIIPSINEELKLSLFKYLEENNQLGNWNAALQLIDKGKWWKYEKHLKINAERNFDQWIKYFNIKV